MYHVIGTITIASLLYLLSYFFYRTGYFSLRLHRKIWNTLLAAAFLFTAFAGLFLALQVNYKWKLPFVEAILKWHVEAGIGLACLGIFHLIWHIAYYSEIFVKARTRVSVKQMIYLSPKDAGINLFIVGFVSSSVQLLLLRELMNITGGYEFISGTFLGSWLILSAAGSALAGRSALNDPGKINLGFSISPLVSLIFLLLLSRLFTITGQTPSFLSSFIYTFIVLLPFCLISGFTFVKLFTMTNRQAGRSFSIETAGGILAGVMVPVLTAGFLNTYQLFLLILILANTYTIIRSLENDTSAVSIKLIAAVLSAAVIVLNPDVLFRQLLLPGIRVRTTIDTPYGNITTGEYSGETTTYYNHRLLTYAGDVVEREEDIHYAMLQCDNPRMVVLVSGSLGSHLKEMMKYNPDEITYIERDPFLAARERIYLDSAKAKINISEDDAFRAIREIRAPVDALLVLIPPPSTLLLNRFYTTEFFQESKKRMSPEGIFMCSPGKAGEYYNEETIRLYSSVFNSLKAAFKNVLPLAGNKVYFIASDKELTSSVASLATKKSIKNIYVSYDYLSDDLIESKTKELLSVLDPSGRQNTADYPVACFSHQSMIFSRDRGEKIPSLILMICLFALPVLLIRRRNFVMYSAASALAGFEIILLLTLQMIAGNMYQLTGILIAGLMAGLAVGAGSRLKLVRHLSISIKGTILAMFFVFAGLVYDHIGNAENVALSIIILILFSFIPGLITGSIFSDLAETGNKDDVPGIYSSDLAGSAIGFILIGSVSVSLVGIKTSVYLLSLIIFAGFLAGTIRTIK